MKHLESSTHSDKYNMSVCLGRLKMKKTSVLEVRRKKLWVKKEIALPQVTEYIGRKLHGNSYKYSFTIDLILKLLYELLKWCGDTVDRILSQSSKVPGLIIRSGYGLCRDAHGFSLSSSVFLLLI